MNSAACYLSSLMKTGYTLEVGGVISLKFRYFVKSVYVISNTPVRITVLRMPFSRKASPNKVHACYGLTFGLNLIRIILRECNSVEQGVKEIRMSFVVLKCNIECFSACRSRPVKHMRLPW